MGPVPLGMGAFCGRAPPSQCRSNLARHQTRASVKEREPVGGRASTSTKSKTDPKDLLLELQRLREQRARLRAELNSKEQRLKAKEVADPQPAHQSVGAHADLQIMSGDEHPSLEPFHVS